MARIMAIDYGTKRTGIAVTDTLQIAAHGLDTVQTQGLMQFLEDYFSDEEVSTVVVGQPVRFSGEPPKVESEIVGFIRKLKKKFPALKIEREDERFTSKEAQRTLVEAGLKKKKRRQKELVDKVSATLILQSYLSSTE